MELASIIVSIVVLVVSVIVVVLGWWKNRNVYDVERMLFFRHNQIDKTNNNDKLKNKLIFCNVE